MQVCIRQYCTQHKAELKQLVKRVGSVILHDRVCFCACLSVREHISGTTRQIFVILCMLSWPWLSPPLAMRYVMYFRFYGYVILAHNGHIRTVAGSDVIASSCAGYVPAA